MNTTALKTKLERTGKQIADNPNQIFTIGLVALGLWGGFKIISALSKTVEAVTPSWGEDKQKAEDKLKESTDKDEKKLNDQGITASYPETTYKQLADKLDIAMTAFFGTDEEAIYNVFRQIKNDLDLVKLIEAFGIRRLEFNIRWGNLGAWLQADLNNQEMAKVNSILAANGVSGRF